MFELFTGKPVFQGSHWSVMHNVLEMDPRHVTELEPTLPNRLDEILDKAIAKPKANRYQTVRALRSDIDEVAAEYHGKGGKNARGR